jgi:hypothetical protein
LIPSPPTLPSDEQLEVEAARGLWLLRDPCRHTTRQWVSTYRRDSQCQLLASGSLAF